MMKKLSYTMAFIACALCGFAETNTTAFAMKITAGTQTYPVVFEDTSLSQAECRMILADYQAMLDMMKPEGVIPIKKESFGDGSRTFVSTKQFKMEGIYAACPVEFQQWVGLISSDHTGREVVLIPSKLSDAYRKVFALETKYPGMLEALQEFVGMMQNLKEAKIQSVEDVAYLSLLAQTSDDPMAVEVRSHFKNWTPEQFVKEYSRKQYKPCSLLWIKEMDGEIVSKIHPLYYEGTLWINHGNLMFRDGKWRILVL